MRTAIVWQTCCGRMQAGPGQKGTSGWATTSCSSTRIPGCRMTVCLTRLAKWGCHRMWQFYSTARVSCGLPTRISKRGT